MTENLKKPKDVPVFFYKEKFDAASQMKGQELRELFNVQPDRDLYLLHGEHGGKEEKIITTQTYDIKPGSHYEDGPMLSGGNGDLLPIPSLLQTHLEELIECYGPFKTYRADSSIIVEFLDYPLPTGVFTKDFSNLKVAVPTPYPQAMLDMVWLEENLQLRNGNSPYVTQQRFINNETLTRISCHVVSQGWNSDKDNFITFLRSVNIFLRGLKVA